MSYSSTEIKHALETLKYDPKWIEWGFLTVDNLIEQLHRVEELSEQGCTEHYRYGAFLTVLKNITSVDDQFIERFIYLAAVDPAIGESAMLKFIGHLMPEQQERYCQHPAFANWGYVISEFANKFAQREFDKFLASAALLTNELLEYFLKHASYEMLYKLSQFDLTREQLQMFVNHTSKKDGYSARQKLITLELQDLIGADIKTISVEKFQQLFSDSGVSNQLQLIENFELTNDQLMLLREKGKNKFVRKAARLILEDRGVMKRPYYQK